MQIANVKHSQCEAKFGFRVWDTKFGCVHRKTLPASECIHGIVALASVNMIFGFYYNYRLYYKPSIMSIEYYLSDR